MFKIHFPHLLILFFIVMLQSTLQSGQTAEAALVDSRPVAYFNALVSPFEITGFPWRSEGEPLYRLPAGWQGISKAALDRGWCTAGGTVRFRTDSPYLAFRISYRRFLTIGPMPLSGTAGLDLYSREPGGPEHYHCTMIPDNSNSSTPLEVLHQLSPSPDGLRSYTLYLPLYSGIQDLRIGVKPGSRLLPPLPRETARPILFYGSSITQGGYASRPASCYSTLLCRALDAPQINLGFYSCATGEAALAEEISRLDLAAFVMDYDYNAPDANHLRKTHEAFFRIIRKARPELPIIILSRCSNMTDERRNVIKATYDHAIARGDRNVRFIDGSEFFGPEGRNFCLVDGIHPSDLGFYRMYEKLLPVLQEVLGRKTAPQTQSR